MAQLTVSGLNSRKWRDQHRTNGRCIRCGKRAHAQGREQCGVCLNRHREEHQRSKHKTDKDVFAAYGDHRCACCNETFAVEFLTIDHIDGDGHTCRETGKRLTGLALRRWLRNNGYPAGYQVLCANCNLAKSTSNECPHVRQRQQMLEAIAALPLLY